MTVTSPLHSQIVICGRTDGQTDRPRDRYTGLFKMIVGILTTCHTQYT